MMKLDNSARRGFSPTLSALGRLCIDRHLANLSLRSFVHAPSLSTQAARVLYRNRRFRQKIPDVLDQPIDTANRIEAVGEQGLPETRAIRVLA